MESADHRQSNQKAIRVIMKFGGSSLANAERVDYVASLIKSQIEQGYRPTVVCSAMGKTTNNLLNAGHFALEGSVYIDSLRTLHLSTAQELGMGDEVLAALEELLDELKNLLSGVSCLRELTPRTLDYLVSRTYSILGFVSFHLLYCFIASLSTRCLCRAYFVVFSLT